MKELHKKMERVKKLKKKMMKEKDFLRYESMGLKPKYRKSYIKLRKKGHNVIDAINKAHEEKYGYKKIRPYWYGGYFIRTQQGVIKYFKTKNEAKKYLKKRKK